MNVLSEFRFDLEHVTTKDPATYRICREKAYRNSVFYKSIDLLIQKLDRQLSDRIKK